MILVNNPLDPDVSRWEIELLDIDPEAFLTLWNSGNDRIGFNPSERAIYDKTQLIARIVREVRLARKEAGEEE